MPIERFNDDNGGTTHVRFFAAAPVTLPVGGALALNWDGTDDAGMPVVPGYYGLLQRYAPNGWGFGWAVGYPASSEAPKTLSRFVLSPSPGRTSRALFQSPADAGRQFVFAMSFGSSQGIQTCGGVVPLDPDSLFYYVSDPRIRWSAHSPAHSTHMAARRRGGAQLTLPDDPSLYGLSFSACFVVINPMDSCPVYRIGEAIESTIW